jgi:hypothetical protein
METLDLEILEKLEAEIESLRIQYEQYFMGMRKNAPEMDRTRITFELRRMANIQSANYAIKFKFQQMTARFNSYNQYWERIIQKLESGQLSRDRLKSVVNTGPLPENGKEAKKEKAPYKPEEKGAAQEEFSNEKLDQIYGQLIESRKQMNQSGTVDKEKLGQALKKQMGQLKEKYKDKKVEFEVVVESGQTKIKARTKK